MVQRFAFLRFLPSLESFRLATPIPVGIRVLGVEHPSKLNASKEEDYKTKLIQP